MKTNQRVRFLLKIVSSLAVFAISTICASAQPTITQQPTNQSVLLGGSANLSVAANGRRPFCIIVSDATGSVTSAVAQITIAGPAPIITLMTNTPLYNVVSLPYTAAPGGQFQLLLTHDLTPPVQWFGPAYIGQPGGASNYNWSYENGANYTEYYPQTFWELDAYP